MPTDASIYVLKDSGDDRAEVSTFDGSNVLSIDCVPTDASIYVLMDSGDDRAVISQYDYSNVEISTAYLPTPRYTCWRIAETIVME